MRALLFAAVSLWAASAYAAGAADSTAAGSAPAKTTGTPAPEAVTTKGAKAAPAKSTPKSAKGTPAAAKSTGAKTIREINIEGELKLPEVLFITSRDVERPLDFLDAYTQGETDAASGKSDAPPVWHVVPPSPAPSTPISTTTKADDDSVPPPADTKPTKTSKPPASKVERR